MCVPRRVDLLGLVGLIVRRQDRLDLSDGDRQRTHRTTPGNVCVFFRNELTARHSRVCHPPRALQVLKPAELIFQDISSNFFSPSSETILLLHVMMMDDHGRLVTP